MHAPTTPNKATVEAARSALRRLGVKEDDRTASASLIVHSRGGDALPVVLPDDAYRALIAVLGELAAGSAVSVVPVESELTTQQAADLLGVSRPYLIGLLDAGRIPFRKVGTHRRIQLSAVTEYKRRDDSEAEAVLAELAAEAQRLGLGY